MRPVVNPVNVVLLGSRAFAPGVEPEEQYLLGKLRQWEWLDTRDDTKREYKHELLAHERFLTQTAAYKRGRPPVTVAEEDTDAFVDHLKATEMAILIQVQQQREQNNLSEGYT